MRTGFHARWASAALVLLLAAAHSASAETPAKVDTDPLNHLPEVRDGFTHFYSGDYDGALARFEHVETEHPKDPIAIDYVLYAVVFRELNRLDLLDTTFYANDGFLTGKHTVVEDTAVRDRVLATADQAMTESNARLAANKDDLNALYARGWARSLQATYLAMVERSFGSALHLALDARSDHAEVLRRDPNYTDANLVVGTYEYVVGALPFSFRLLIGIAGIHGNKDKGMELLRVAAARGVTTSVEARTCMMLFLRREAKYGEALAIAHTLAAEYPHGFLFHLEEANLSKDAGEGMKAVELYRALINKARAQPDFYPAPHPELADYGLGESLRGQKLYQDAVAAYRDAAASPRTSPELKRRCLLAAGQSYDLMGKHSDAVVAYQQVIDAGGDTVQADQARKFIKKAYTAS